MLTYIIRFIRIILDNQLKKIKKGSNVQINSGFNCLFPERIKIGDNVYIGPNAKFWAEGSIEIDSGVIIGPECTIYTSNHNYNSDNLESIPYDGKTILKKVKIEKNVWVGGNVIILPGSKIKEGSIIGAGSVITKEVPSFAVVGGNPAKIIGHRDEQTYEKLKLENKIYLKLKKNGKVEYEKVTISK